MAGLSFAALAELLEEVRFDVVLGARRRQRKQEGDELRRAQMRTDDVRDEPIVLVARGLTALDRHELSAADKLADAPREVGLDLFTVKHCAYSPTRRSTCRGGYPTLVRAKPTGTNSR